MEKVFVFGSGGHAKVVMDLIRCQKNLEIAFLLDDDPSRKGQKVLGYEVIGGRRDLSKHHVRKGIVAVGDNSLRTKIASELKASGVELISLVHPSVSLGSEVHIGEGSVVMAGCVLNSGVRLGSNVIINTGATVDHDCSIGDGVHIAPGCTLCGTVTVGEGSLLGVGSCVVPGIRIGKNVLVKAGTTVTRDLPDVA